MHLSVCHIRDLPFECLDIQTSFLIRMHPTSSEYLCQGRVSRLWDRGQGHTSVTKYASYATRVVAIRSKGNLVPILIWNDVE